MRGKEMKVQAKEFLGLLYDQTGVVESLKDGVNDDAMLSDSQQRFITSTIHLLEDIAADSDRPVDWWFRLVPMTTYINTCR
jgi:hypothetical protein